jgi:hypothetical protein
MFNPIPTSPTVTALQMAQYITTYHSSAVCIRRNTNINLCVSGSFTVENTKLTLLISAHNFVFGNNN